MYDKFVTLKGELQPASPMFLAIDLHEEGKIQFIAASIDKDKRNRKTFYHFRHNGKLMKVPAHTVRFYFLALINER